MRTTLMAAVSAMALVATPVLAQTSSGSKSQGGSPASQSGQAQESKSGQSGSKATRPDGQRISAMDVLGKRVTLSQGKKDIGEISDVVVVGGKVENVVVEVRDLKDKPVMISYRALTPSGDSYVLSMTEAQLQQAPAYQRNGKQQASESSGKKQAAKTSSDRQAVQKVQVRGTISNVKDVPRRGSDETYRVFLLDTPRGNQIIVDAGMVGANQEPKVESGEKVAFIGTPGRVGNRMVFFADAVKVGDRVQRLRRPEGAGSEQQAQETASQYRHVKGEVVKARATGVRGTDKQNRMLLIKTESGNRLAVDVGSGEATQNIGAKKGEQISVRGREIRVGDRLILMADAVRVGEKTYDVDRPMRRYTN